MYIQLEQYDYDAIAELVAECDNGNTKVSYSDFDIEISFYKYVREHRDDDYYNGTGAWETDSVDFSLGDVECSGVEIKYNSKELEKTIEDYLWNR